MPKTSAKSATSKKSLFDSVILVDETDHPIGTMDKYDAHRNGAHLHRAISIYLFTRKNDAWHLLMQQRSPKKIVGGEMWANTVCGNVRPGESYRECATRRLREELGLRMPVIEETGLETYYKFQYSVKCNEEFSEREMDSVFVGIVSPEQRVDFNESLKPNQSEVIATDWVDFSELIKTATNEQWSPEVPVTYQTKLLAPWFVWMMRDADLLAVLQELLEQKLSAQKNLAQTIESQTI